MEKKLIWNEILENFSGEWIELVDYNWPDNHANPISGVVTVHSPERREFIELCKLSASSPKDRAVIFVGAPNQHPQATYLNLMKYGSWG